MKDDSQFDLRAFLSRYLLRYWYVYALGAATAYTAAWLKIRYATPIYQMRNTILLEDEQSRSGYVSPEVILSDLGMAQSGPRVFNEIQVLKSRPIMTEVVRRLGLGTEYYIKGRVRTSELYPGAAIRASLAAPAENGYDTPFNFEILDTLRYRLDIRGKQSEHQFGEQIRLPEGDFVFTLQGSPSPEAEYFVVFRRPEDAAGKYLGALNITLINNYSTALEMTFKSPVPQKGADILNAIVEVYNDATVRDKNRVGENTIRFIDDRLRYLSTELNEVETQLERYKRSNDIPSEISSSVSTLIEQYNASGSLTDQLEIRHDLLTSLQEYLRDQLKAFEPAPINLLPDDARIATLVERYNGLVVDRERLLRSAKPENPVVQNLSAQVAVLRNALLETIAAAVRDVDLQRADSRRRGEEYLARVRTIPQKERGLLEIKRQQGIKESLFLYLLQKREETALSLAAALPGSRMVDPATDEGWPISPNRRAIFMQYLLIGLLLPAAFVYLRYALVTTLETESEITAATNTPILGSIGYKPSREGAVVVRKNSRSAMAEMFRLLRTNLSFLTAGQENKVVLITSSLGGEGKSFITLNLGITMAMADKKTVIVELDLRKPKLVRYLTQKPAETGITNYLIGQYESAAGLVKPSEVHPNLFYVGSGPIPPNPAELLLSQKLEDFIRELRAEYDYVLLDTPPAGMVTDAFLLGRVADSSLYIVRHGHTRKSDLDFIDETYASGKLPRMAIVYNGLRLHAAYGYGSRYGYGYGYGYYEDTREKRGWRRFFLKG